MKDQSSNTGLAPKSDNPIKGFFTLGVIILIFIVSILIYMFVLGNGSNFEGGNPENNPTNYLGQVHKGGVIVPILMSLLLMVFTFSIERFITIFRASGSIPADAFLHKIRTLLLANNVDAAIAECDKQKGSLGNVVKSGLRRYKEMQTDTTIDKDQKLAAIQKDLEEATELELPTLENNLVIIATVSSVATLFGLLGTVIGMIKAFHALAQAGAPDSLALATGISEALINTALGIFSSAMAIIAYNYFTTKIDRLTYSIDEAGFSILQTYSSTQK